MGWRILQITKPCRLSIKQRQLNYAPDGDEELNIPIEDISVLILENHLITLTNALLSSLVDNGVVVFTCDTSHLPNGALFPFHNHFHYAEIAGLQIDMSEPLRKRLWQEVIKAKISNQGRCLTMLDRDNGDKLVAISDLVLSGDARNAEAFAANLYWKSMFADFNRNDDEDIRNSALNYGYAIIRGCMARAVVGAGLLPCLGIHHANKLNQFNLVDDLMEPFRPFVDYQINQIDLSRLKNLDTLTKHQLVAVLTQNCLFNNEEINLLKACELTALSMVKAIKNKEAKYLQLPVLKKIPIFE